MLFNRILLIFIRLIIIIKLNTVYASSTPSESDNENCSNVCSSSACIEQASYFQSYMDQKIDPCDDFYEFVCGDFSNKLTIPAGSNAISMLDDFQNKMKKDIFDEIKASIEQNDSEASRKTKTYFQNCMNETHIEEEGVKPFLEILEKLGGWPVLLGDDWKENNWEDTVKNFNSLKFGIFFPFTVSVASDMKNPSKYFLRLSPASTTITNSFFLKNNKTLNAYFDYMVDIATELGANKNVALEQMGECLEFDLKLQKIKTSPKHEIIRMSVNDLTKKYPDIPWSIFLNEIFNSDNASTDKNQIVEVENLDYFQKLYNLLTSTPKRVLANYQIWQYFSKIIHTMPSKFVEKQSNYFTKIGKKDVERETRCLNEVILNFGVCASFMYLKKYSNNGTDRNVIEIANKLKDQFINILEVTNWMDDDTKKYALIKLGDVIFFNYPNIPQNEKLIDRYYRDVNITSGNYISSFVNTSAFITNKAYELLKSPNVGIKSIFARGTHVTPFYSLSKNSIAIPSTTLQKPIFQIEGPEYLNYGAVGTIIGRELIHGFSVIGQKFGRNGQNYNWWSNKTNENYSQKINCLLEKYNDYSLSETGHSVFIKNNHPSLNDIMRQIGGSQLAYQTYNKWKNQNNIVEPCLPGLNYTSNQMIWINAATYYCQKKSDKVRDSDIVNGISNRAFVAVSFSNSKDFAKDFNCKVGSTMNPIKKCDIW